MITYDQTFFKVQQLPLPLLEEVNDFIDFLLLKAELRPLAESDMTDYLTQLTAYEEDLADNERNLWKPM